MGKKRVFLGIFAFLVLCSSLYYVFALTNPIYGVEADNDAGCGCVNVTNPSGIYRKTVNSYNYIFCGENDGVCPEKIKDASTGKAADCSNCPDPDCMGLLSGVVSDDSDPGIAIIGAEISLFAGSSEYKTYSDGGGVYSLTAPSGNHYVRAVKEGYDTVIKQVLINTGGTNTENFILTNGTCHADCTNSQNRCNPDCQGLSFDDGDCDFFDETYEGVYINASELCMNRKEGSTVIINIPGNDTHAIYLDCCEGTPYIKPYFMVELSSSNIKNLIQYKRLVKLDEQPVKLIVAVWE
ncbi:carboxypeptidase regulatory-like domain-containing protein [Candidatus Woesearchaeota archaeon]|nr:carboxypeptidase regulatory-like domain-containing protein [Candidatus Woesearchaeota archaeon]